MHGAEKSMVVERDHIAISLLLSLITILGFDEQAAEEYGRIKAAPEKTGTPIDPMDTLIAGHAKQKGLILMTINTRKFNCANTSKPPKKIKLTQFHNPIF